MSELMWFGLKDFYYKFTYLLETFNDIHIYFKESSGYDGSTCPLRKFNLLQKKLKK